MQKAYMCLSICKPPVNSTVCAYTELPVAWKELLACLWLSFSGFPAHAEGTAANYEIEVAHMEFCSQNILFS